MERNSYRTSSILNRENILFSCTFYLRVCDGLRRIYIAYFLQCICVRSKLIGLGTEPPLKNNKINAMLKKIRFAKAIFKKKSVYRNCYERKGVKRHERFDSLSSYLFQGSGTIFFSSCYANPISWAGT